MRYKSRLLFTIHHQSKEDYSHIMRNTSRCSAQYIDLKLIQTISFTEISIEAGILLGGKHEACFVLGVAGIEPMPSWPNRPGHRFRLEPTWLRGRFKANTIYIMMAKIFSAVIILIPVWMMGLICFECPGMIVCYNCTIVHIMNISVIKQVQANK